MHANLFQPIFLNNFSVKNLGVVQLNNEFSSLEKNFAAAGRIPRISCLRPEVLRHKFLHGL
jgi:hypothetical protein